MAFALVALLGTVAQAQTVHWESDPGNPSTLRLVFTDCAPDGDPELPAIPGATLTYVGSEQNTSIVNFQVTRTATLTYLVRSRQSGPVQIPAFPVKTNRGAVRVAAFDAATPAAPLESVASARLVPERNSVWAGEVFGLTYELSASRRNNPQVNQTFDWNPAPLVAEDWSKPEVTETVVNGERRLQVVYRTRAVGTLPNTIRLEAANHLMNIQTGTVGLGFLQQPRMEPVSVTSDQPVIEVKPLPPSPAGFSGAVGQFTLESKVVPERAAVGEPVTWTLELKGTGNWPDIAGLPPREVSNDFQVVQPKAKRLPEEGKLFDVSLMEDVVLVPTKPGTYTLGPISFTYFNSKSGSYHTVSTPRTTLAISPPAAPQFNVMPQADPGTGVPDIGSAAPGFSESGIRSPTPSPLPPAGIPRDPLPGATGVN
ncbi:MAG: BatD family protein, partial [Opitutus sp.]